MKFFIRALQSKKVCDVCGNDKSYLNFLKYSLGNKTIKCYCYKCSLENNVLGNGELKLAELRYLVRLGNTIGDILFSNYASKSDEIVKNPLEFFIKNCLKSQSDISLKFITESNFNIKVNDSDNKTFLTISVGSITFVNLNKIILGNFLYKKLKNKNTSLTKSSSKSYNNVKDNSVKEIVIHREVLSLIGYVSGYLILKDDKIVYISESDLLDNYKNKLIKIKNASYVQNDNGKLILKGIKSAIPQQYFSKSDILDANGKLKKINEIVPVGNDRAIYILREVRYGGYNDLDKINNVTYKEIDLGGNNEVKFEFIDINLKTFETSFISLKFKLKLFYNFRYNNLESSGSLYKLNVPGNDNIFVAPVRHYNYFFNIYFDIVSLKCLLDYGDYFDDRVDSKILLRRFNSVYHLDLNNNKINKIFNLDIDKSDLKYDLNVNKVVKVNENKYLYLLSSEETLKDDYEYEVYKYYVYLVDFKNGNCLSLYKDREFQKPDYNEYDSDKIGLKVIDNKIYYDGKLLKSLDN